MPERTAERSEPAGPAGVEEQDAGTAQRRWCLRNWRLDAISEEPDTGPWQELRDFWAQLSARIQSDIAKVRAFSASPAAPESKRAWIAVCAQDAEHDLGDAAVLVGLAIAELERLDDSLAEAAEEMSRALKAR